MKISIFLLPLLPTVPEWTLPRYFLYRYTQIDPLLLSFGDEGGGVHLSWEVGSWELRESYYSALNRSARGRGASLTHSTPAAAGVQGPPLCQMEADPAKDSGWQSLPGEANKWGSNWALGSHRHWKETQDNVGASKPWTVDFETVSQTRPLPCSVGYPRSLNSIPVIISMPVFMPIPWGFITIAL